MSTEQPNISKERSTMMQLEDTCNRLIAENDKLRKAVNAAHEWARKPIKDGGGIPDFAEDIAPLLAEALGEQDAE